MTDANLSKDDERDEGYWAAMEAELDQDPAYGDYDPDYDDDPAPVAEVAATLEGTDPVAQAQALADRLGRTIPADILEDAHKLQVWMVAAQEAVAAPVVVPARGPALKVVGGRDVQTQVHDDTSWHDLLQPVFGSKSSVAQIPSVIHVVSPAW